MRMRGGPRIRKRAARRARVDFRVPVPVRAIVSWCACDATLALRLPRTHPAIEPTAGVPLDLALRAPHAHRNW